MYPGERINAITHLVGAALGLVGMVLVIVLAAVGGDGWKLASALVYGLSLFLLFLFSTLYHSLQGTEKVVFQRFDHIGIFLLIAGTYTPYCLVTLRDRWGFVLFGIVWGLALGGIVLKSIWGARWSAASTAVYLLMGWIIVLDIGALKERLPGAGFAWLLLGGLLYSVGVVFFANPRIPFHHQIWHLFVLAAATCHYVSIVFYVIL